MNINPFEKFNSEWALVTSGESNNFNTMTISWGSMGTVWSKSVVTIYVRPDRYTWKFLKEYDKFTITFFPPMYHDDLLTLGRLSGKNTNKVELTQLTPIALDDTIGFEEASTTIICKKIYMAPMNYEDVPEYAKAIYQNGIQPHYIIMGEVLNIK